MKKRSKILAALTAGVMAVSAMCFGFAQWSTEISLGGNVSASGTWDVSVTDAAVTLSSAGADLVEQTVVNDPTYEVVLYDVYADYSFLGDYCFTVDDNNPHTVSLTAEEFNPYDEDNGKQIGAYSFKSGVSGTAYSRSDYTFVLNCREEAEHIVTGWENKPYLPAADNGAMDGQCIGQAVALRYNTQMPMNERIIMSHDDAKAFYQANPRTETTVPAETTFTAGSVSYAPVHFSLPGAWAQYSVTITNQGTAKANLRDYRLTLDQLPELYQVDMPECGEDEVLQPGESCIIQFVISVDVQEEHFAEGSQTFTLHLTYEQDAVGAAPASSHTHTK